MLSSLFRALYKHVSLANTLLTDCPADPASNSEPKDCQQEPKEQIRIIQWIDRQVIKGIRDIAVSTQVRLLRPNPEGFFSHWLQFHAWYVSANGTFWWQSVYKRDPAECRTYKYSLEQRMQLAQRGTSDTIWNDVLKEKFLKTPAKRGWNSEDIVFPSIYKSIPHMIS